MSMADVWWMENGSELCDELTKERDEARAEVARLRSVMAERDTLSARVRQLQDEALDVAECRRLANVAVDQAEAARSKLRSVTAERDGLRALCDRVREAWARVHETPMPTDEARRVMRAAIEALGPGGEP